MEIQLWWTGKTQLKFISTGLEEYLQRLSHLCKFKVHEFKGTRGLQDPALIRKREEEEISSRLQSGDYLILLDEKGTMRSSTELATHLDKLQQQSHSRIIFLIGGAYGFSDEFRSKARELISFSSFTLSHQLIRLFLAEQLYRAFTIIKKIPYHND